MNPVESIEAIIRVLEHCQRHPAVLTVSPPSVDAMITGIQGFNMACLALGLFYSDEIEREVLHNNGWERLAEGVWGQMRKRGMDEEAIVRAVIGLEIEMWKHLLRRERQASPREIPPQHS